MSNKKLKINLLAVASLGSMLVSCALVTGCGSVATIGGDANTYSSAANLSGKVHGGQFPIVYSTVKLYSAGTSGYGAGATLLATATTGTGGAFSMPKSSVNGPSSGTSNTWACPATTDDPQLYLIATGGNSQNTGLNDAADTNAGIALLAAIGPCSKVTSSTFVVIDEVSTTAGVFALAPYMNVGTTAGTEVIGTNGANVSTNTPQGAVGLDNAVAGIANLTATSTAYTNTGVTSVAAVTVTATPEANKVNTIADILASCVNTTTLPSANCTQLFNAAVSATGTQPVDTIQAAYYMATNPTDIASTTFTSCGGSYTTNLQCLYALVGGTGAPFQGTLASVPTDWTIGVTYSATGGCSNNSFGGALFFDSPTKEAIDANGNIYIVNGSTSKAAIVEMSPVGQPLACVIPAVATGTAQTYGSGVTIDPAGDIWAIFGHATFTNSVVEWPLGATLPTSYSPAAEPFGIVSDGDGNVFYTTAATSGTMYEFVAPATGSASPTGAVVAVPQLYSTNNTTTLTVNAIAADSTGRVLADTASIASFPVLYPLLSSITAYAVSGGSVTFTGTNTFAVGQTVTITGLTTTEGAQFNGQRIVITAATGSSFTGATTAATITTTTDSGSARATGAGAYAVNLVAGYSSSYGLGLDSTSHVYTGTSCCSNGTTGWGKLQKFTLPTASSGTATDVTSAQFLAGLGGTRSVAVDGASHVWMGQYWWESVNSASTNVYGLVEMAAPTVGSTTTFSAISPTGAGTCAGTAAGGCATGGAFQKSSFLAITDVAIDPSGNVWTVSNGPNIPTSSTGTIAPYSPSTQPLGTVVVEVVGAATPIVTPLSVAAKNGTVASRP